MFLTRYHRHKNYENQMLELQKEMSDLKAQLFSIYGKVAVNARENKRSKPMPKALDDAEIRAIMKQIPGDVVAVQDSDGKLLDIEDNE